MKASESKNRYKVCIIVFPSNMSTNQIFLSSMSKILEQLTDNIFIISGNLSKQFFGKSVNIIDIGPAFKLNNAYMNNLSMVLFIVYYQILMSYNLLKISRDVQIVFFYLSYFCQFPIILSKILGKKTVLLQTYSLSTKTASFVSLSPISKKLGPKLIKFNCALVDYIVPESDALASGYSEFKDKVISSGARFVDVDMFKFEKPLNHRKNEIGYIGRFSKEKGVINFIKSIPFILANRDDVVFKIIGDGPLYKEIKEMLDQYPADKISLHNWKEREDMPNCLNNLKLIVLPSYTEGLPTIILEAMACGSLVLATSVGAITDVVENGRTGFILENNAPQCIAMNVLKIINRSDLELIVRNARELIEKEYSFEKSIERYQIILNTILP